MCEAGGAARRRSACQFLLYASPATAHACLAELSWPLCMRDSQVVCAAVGREFTLSMMSEWFVESANHTCAPQAHLEIKSLNITYLHVRKPEFETLCVSMAAAAMWRRAPRSAQGAVLSRRCGSYDRGVDELELAGLTPVASVLVKPPRVAESVVQLECKLRGTHEIKNAKGESTGRIMIGEVGLPKCDIACHRLPSLQCG